MQVIRVVPLSSVGMASCVSCCVSTTAVKTLTQLQQQCQRQQMSPLRPNRTALERCNQRSPVSPRSARDPSVIVQSTAKIPFAVHFAVTLVACFTKQLSLFVEDVRVNVTAQGVLQENHIIGSRRHKSHVADARSPKKGADRALHRPSENPELLLAVEENFGPDRNFRDDLTNLSVVGGGTVVDVSTVISSPFSYQRRNNDGAASTGISVSAPPMLDDNYHYNVAVPLSSGMLIRDTDTQVPADSFLRCILDPCGFRVVRARKEDIVHVARAGSMGATTRPSSAPRSARKPSISGDWEDPKITKTGKVIDSPLVFSSTRIKSSGYGQTPNNPLDVLAKRRQERLTKDRSARLERTHSAGYNAAIAVGARLRMYPVDCGIMSIPHESTEQSGRHSHPVDQQQVVPAIKGCAISTDANCLALATNDNNILTLKLPFKSQQLSTSAADIYSCYRGHNGVVNNVEFSFDKKLLLSSSADCTVRLFRRNRYDAAAVIFTHTQHSPTGEKNKIHTQVSVCESGKEYGHCISTGPRQVHGQTVSISSSSSKRGTTLQYDSNLSKRCGNGAAVELEPAPGQRNKPFAASIMKASFYYQDKFVALV
jgi:hypothetical protein